MTAPDEREVEDRLRSGGSFLIEAEVRARPGMNKGLTDAVIPRKQLLAFMEYLSSSIQVGMPLLGTLSDVEQRLESKKLRQIVSEVRHSVSEEGKSLSEALADHPKAFPEVYITTIQAGETSGRLDFVLAQLVTHLDWQETITGQLKQATTYPIIVLTAVVGLLTILVGFVFPRLLPVLQSRNEVLPLPTRIVIATSNFIRHKGLYLLVAFAILYVIWRVVKKNEDVAMAADRIKMKIPVIGNFIREVTMARVVTYLGLFYRSGVEIILALSLVERMITNRVAAAAVRSVRDDVEGGETMANAFGRVPIFPPMVVRSIALGEATGQLDESLGRVAAYYEREIPNTVRRMITALQPMLIAVMGGMVLLVALAMILPIMGIYSSIGVRR